MKTGNKDLDNWINFFSKDKKSLTKYISMLQKMDKTFLTKGFPQDIDDDNLLPLNGLLEQELIKILKNKEKDLSEAYTILVLAVYYGVNFETWKPIYKEKISTIFEKCLIEGTYEEFNIDLDKIISTFIIKELIDKKSFMAIAFLRGIQLGKKYDTEEKEKTLEKLMKKNYWKIKIGI